MSRHIIHQQAIEIDTADRNSAQPVFLEISRLFNNRAKDAAGYILDKYDQENELIRIDVLEVDIGTVPFPFSEESFVKVYSEKLEDALAGAIKKQLQLAESKTRQNDPDAAKQTLLQLLEKFLTTGTIAWWAGKEELKDPVRIFKTLQEKEMPMLQSLIVRLFPEAMVRKRFVYSFTGETVKTVIGIIQPAEKEFIIRYHARVSHLQTENRFVRTDNTGFRKVLWLFILDFLADQSGSRFNRKMFVLATLTAIAHRFNMHLRELLFFFSEALKDVPENFRRTENLLSLVEEITFEQAQQDGVGVTGSSDLSDNSEDEELQQEGRPLFFFLLNGFLPLGFQDKEKASLNTDLMSVLRNHRSYARLFFEKHGRLASVRKRLLTDFTEENIKAVVQLVEPSGSELIVSYTTFITEFQKKHRFVPTEENTFGQVIWDLILTRIFLQKQSVFNARSFLAYHLEELALHYAIDTVRLQAILVQGTAQQNVYTNSRSLLFSLLADILLESTAVRQSEVPALRPTTSGPINERVKNEPDPGKKLSLSEILSANASATDTVQKSFVMHIILHLFETGKLPEWSESVNASVEAFVGHMRISYPNELRAAFLYAAKTGKTGFYFLHTYASLFKTDLILLFEKIFPEKLISFFHELQSRYALPDVLFAQGLYTALAVSPDKNPDLSAFFSFLFEHIRRIQGKGTIKALTIYAGVFASIKDSHVLRQALNKAAEQHTYHSTLTDYEYSDENFRQVLAISVQDTKIIIGNELPDSLVKWIRHYTIYQQIPLDIKLPELINEKQFVAWAMEFLFRNHKQTFQKFYYDVSLNTHEQELVSELLQSSGSHIQVRYFLEAEHRKLALSNNTGLEDLNLYSPEGWKQLMQKMEELPSGNPLYAKQIMLTKQESSRGLMARYISDKGLKQLFEKDNQPDLWHWYCHFEEVFLKGEGSYFEQRQLRIRIVEFFLMLFAGQISVQRSARDLSAHFIPFLSIKPDEPLTVVKEKITRRKNTEKPGMSAIVSELIECLIIELDQLIHRNHTAKIIEKEIRTMEKELHFNLNDNEKKRFQEEQQKQRSQTTDLNKDKVQAFGEQVYIQNAGMILLHPFLATLFARAELTTDGVFRGEEAQAKAVQLMQYAVTGAEQDPEYDLVLNKLLAGLRPGDVLSHTADLETGQKELITGMLHAIMMQWDKMKNTSLEGFRSAFLMREGYVFETEESWVLRVEQRGYDIILQTLPWSFGMIKFSWMNKPLIVEWN